LYVCDVIHTDTYQYIHIHAHTYIYMHIHTIHPMERGLHFPLLTESSIPYCRRLLH
jgi:hypothetical protein